MNIRKRDFSNKNPVVYVNNSISVAMFHEFSIKLNGCLNANLAIHCDYVEYQNNSIYMFRECCYSTFCICTSKIGIVSLLMSIRSHSVEYSTNNSFDSDVNNTLN